MRLRQLTIDRPWGGCLPVATALALACVAQPSGAHSLEVRHDAALGGGFGLELRLDGLGRDGGGDAYLGLGAADGLTAETALEIRVALDVSGLELAPPAGRTGVLPFLRLAPAEEAPPRVVVSLARPATGPWLVTAWAWDENASRLVAAGWAPLAAAGEARTRLLLRWSAPTPEGATLQVLRQPPSGSPVLLFQRELPAGAGLPVGALRLGSLADDGRGVAGRLRLDDFAVSRLQR